MEKKYFKFARWVFFIISSLALAGTILMLVNGLTKSNAKVNDKVEPKAISFDEFKDDMNVTTME